MKCTITHLHKPTDPTACVFEIHSVLFDGQLVIFGTQLQIGLIEIYLHDFPNVVDDVDEDNGEEDLYLMFIKHDYMDHCELAFSFEA